MLASVWAIVSCMYTLFRIASLLCLICFLQRSSLYLLFLALYFHSSKSKQISDDFGKRSSQPFSSFDRTIDPKMLNKRKMPLFTIARLLCLISKQYYCDKEKRKFEPHTGQIMHVRTQILCDITIRATPLSWTKDIFRAWCSICSTTTTLTRTICTRFISQSVTSSINRNKNCLGIILV